MDLSLLNRKISEVAPVFGLSSSGRIDFKPFATSEQMKAAEAIMDAYMSNPARWIEENTPPPTAQEFLLEQGYDSLGLLTLKNLLDKIGPGVSPKLDAVSAWTSQILGMYVHGQFDYPARPFTFQETVIEAYSHLKS